MRNLIFLCAHLIFLSYENYCLAASVNEGFPSAELQALQDLYISTNGAWWTWKNDSGVEWNFTASSPNPCVENWQGISCNDDTCEPECHVTSIYLMNYNMSGMIPESLSYLASVESIDFSHNMLFGTIGLSFCRFELLSALSLANNFFSSSPCFFEMDGTSVADSLIENLKTLQLSDNLLTGTIASISYASLEEISLEINSFSGPIDPVSMSHNLVAVNLGNNLLSGEFPISFCGLKRMQRLDLTRNFLVAELPNCISEFQNMTELKLGFNLFWGHLPSAICNLTSLVTLNVENNFLSEMLPTCLTNHMSSLQSLNLQNNRFNGSIPECIFKTISLNSLLLARNEFTGSISNSVGALVNMTTIDLTLNQFTGSLPDELFSLRFLSIMDVSFNLLNGSLPTSLGYGPNCIVGLSLAGNQISGTLPTSIGNLQDLRILNLAGNNITSEIPSSIRNLTNLQYLDLSYNNFTGGIKEEIILLTNLSWLNLGENYNLGGSIPESIGNLTNLTSLLLKNCGLQGTLPVGISELFMLRFLYVEMNAIGGTVPPALYHLQNLTTLDLSYNNFVGYIHSDISLMVGLRFLFLNNNKFDRSLPSEMGLLKGLLTVDLQYNYITGTLPPELCNMTALKKFMVNDNLLSKLIPNCMTDNALANYLYIDVADNSFSGSLPAFTADGLIYLSLGFNNFVGSLPASYATLHSLNFLLIQGNSLTGSIPSDYFTQPNLHSFFCFGNILSGTLPNILSEHQSMYQLVIYKNIFSGTLPNMSNLFALQSLYIQDNAFTGILADSFSLNTGNETVLNSTNIVQSRYNFQYIDVSKNKFKGPLPVDLFRSDILSDFAAVSNCLTGSLPVALCSASQLTSLILDGINSGCDQQLFPGSSINTYALQERIRGKIPSCLFSMNHLQILHLSGNGIAGSLDINDEDISNSLNQLDLSYNLLTGSIPKRIQEKEWLYLSLERNRFGGVLLSSFSSYSSDNSTLKLTGNRLSGNVPSRLLDAKNIAILDGNLFYCSATDRDNWLPKHDADSSKYQCGSNTTNQVFVVWGCIFAIIAVMAATVVVIYYYRDRFFEAFARLSDLQDLISHWMSIYDAADINSNLRGGTDQSQLVEFGDHAKSLRKTTISLSLILILIFLPIYCGVSTVYNSYSVQYIWLFSGIFLNGGVPSVVFLLMWAALLTFLASKFSVKVFFKDDNSIRRYVKQQVDMTDLEKQHRYWHLFRLCIVATFNFAVNLLVDSGYVVVLLYGTLSEVASIQVGLAIFKILWNNIFLRILFRWVRKLYMTPIVMKTIQFTKSISFSRMEVREKYFLVTMVILNSIVIPCIAIAVVNTDCFYYVWAESDSIKSSYNQTICMSIQPDPGKGDPATCGSSEIQITTQKYNPPFLYSYQCSSTFIANYSPIYGLMALFSSIIAPTVTFICAIWYTRLLSWQSVNGMARSDDEGNQTRETSWDAFKTSCLKYLRRTCIQILDFSLPVIWKPPIEDFPEDHSTLLFDRDRILILLNGNLMILVTFGVVFPPLAVLQCIAIIAITLFEQLSMGRLIYNANVFEYYQYQRILERECKNTFESLLDAIWLLLPVSAAFFSFFLFDTYSSSVSYGSLKGISFIWSMCLLPLLLWLIVYWYNRVIKQHADRLLSSTTPGASIDVLRRRSLLHSWSNRPSAATVSSAQQQEEAPPRETTSDRPSFSSFSEVELRASSNFVRHSSNPLSECEYFSN